jgi:hypothetical protein
MRTIAIAIVGAWVVPQAPWTMGKDLGYGLWKVLEYDRTDAE